MGTPDRRVLGAALLLCACLSPAPAPAVLDIRERGPSLTAGSFSLRVTNAGLVGNAFFDVGLSNDPSFEFPIGSGHEVINYAALWVGALDEFGEPHVSGGPILEFRPTLDPDDHVFLADRGRLGARPFVDDDGDGRMDEERLNDRDDDGDGEIDEDLGLFSQQLAAADYADDQPEAIQFGYPNGERHHPLGISVHQEAYAWSVPGYDGIAGLQFTITNHGERPLNQLFVGLYADLDSRNREDRAGHVNDRVTPVGYSRTVFEGISYTTFDGTRYTSAGGPITCTTTLEQTLPAVVDGRGGSGLPAVAVMALDHTTDPLALLEPIEARRAARAPGKVSFRTSVFANGRLQGRGGPPLNDADRYAALAGTLPGAGEAFPADYVVLVSCGPFASLAPGQSIEFAAALIAAESVDSLRRAIGNTAIMYHGEKVNLLADSSGQASSMWRVGESGLNGHEVCIEPPARVTFLMDPDCPNKFPADERPPEILQTYSHGRCIWTDADCDLCTGLNGFETIRRWRDPGQVPPQPGYRAVALDHAVRVEWDNMPEILFHAGITLPPQAGSESRFLGYRLWKLADWRDRQSLVPDRSRWALVAAFGPDTLFGEKPLPTVTDSSLDYLRILYEQPRYPVGRYRWTDREVLNGFDYLYVVTSRYEIAERDSIGAPLRFRRVESPFDADFAERVSPRAEARPGVGDVWVVPNPFKAWADWSLPRTPGDQLTRHIDFMGLPRAVCTIKIWTVAGDFVAQVDHDGRSGNGQASWNLVTRNGQEAVSGIYLFSVDSPAGHKVGRFVVVR